MPFRKKLVGMARRAVRIVQRSCRDLFPSLFLHQIQDSLTLFSFVTEDRSRKYFNVRDFGLPFFRSVGLQNPKMLQYAGLL